MTPFKDIVDKMLNWSSGAMVGASTLTVLGLAVAAQYPAREAIEPAIVGLHDLAERGLVPAPRPVDQLGFRYPDAGAQAGCGPWHDGSLVSIGSGHWMQASGKGSRISCAGSYPPLEGYSIHTSRLKSERMADSM